MKSLIGKVIIRICWTIEDWQLRRRLKRFTKALDKLQKRESAR